MEVRRIKTVARQPNTNSFTSFDDTADTQERLNALIAANAEIRQERAMFRDFQEQTEAEMMRHPFPVRKAFAYYGLMLGTFPPAAIFLKILSSSRIEDFGLVVLLFLVNLICAVVGYFSGKLIGKMVLAMEKQSWHLMLITLPFIGVLWGVITGAAGGVLIFVIGAFFGAISLAIVGSIAVPAFTIFHRLLKKGEMIERNQFLPIAFGVTFIISAFILGL